MWPKWDHDVEDKAADHIVEVMWNENHHWTIECWEVVGATLGSNQKSVVVYAKNEEGYVKEETTVKEERPRKKARKETTVKVEESPREAEETPREAGEAPVGWITQEVFENGIKQMADAMRDGFGMILSEIKHVADRVEVVAERVEALEQLAKAPKELLLMRLLTPLLNSLNARTNSGRLTREDFLEVVCVNAKKGDPSVSKEDTEMKEAEEARGTKEAEEVNAFKEAEEASAAKEAEEVKANAAKEAEEAKANATKEAEEVIADKEAKETKAAKASKAAKEADAAKAAKEADAAKAAKEADAPKAAKEAKTLKEAKAAKALRDAKAAKALRDAKAAKEARDAKSAEDAKAAKEVREAKEARDAEEAKEVKETEEAEECKTSEGIHILSLLNICGSLVRLPRSRLVRRLTRRLPGSRLVGRLTRRLSVSRLGSRPDEQIPGLAEFGAGCKQFRKKASWGAWDLYGAVCAATVEERCKYSLEPFTYEVVNAPQCESGDCGLFALKYIECHTLGFPFSRSLNPKNSKAIREKMAMDIFEEILDAHQTEITDVDVNQGMFD
ncbi:hypothetical protein N665_0142s0001 [Sinapis alba]|nr:hypothetical protein N665_0142s0001 [Sinapis alba]